MAAVKSENTRPEITVRKFLHKQGFRYRLHRKDLPGKPDIVLPKYKTCIFVHGCFWHSHPGCRRASMPKFNKKFWEEKLTKNVIRDRRVITELEALGWCVCVIWECETKDKEKLGSAISDCLGKCIGKE